MDETVMVCPIDRESMERKVGKFGVFLFTGKGKPCMVTTYRFFTGINIFLCRFTPVIMMMVVAECGGDNKEALIKHCTILRKEESTYLPTLS